MAATATGLLCSVLGGTRMRQVVLALGFPLSWWISSSAPMPAWAWLLPLVLALLIYPVHSWRDAPLFPTPLNALRELPLQAPLKDGAVIMDAGCGLGDGLRALRLAYPLAHFGGLTPVGHCDGCVPFAALGPEYGLQISGRPLGPNAIWSISSKDPKPWSVQP